jgi:hypothetical protein
MSAGTTPARPSKRWAVGFARAAVALCLALFAWPTQALAERRCGWLENPTPGNLWLKDASGFWTISTQGGPPAEGADRLPTPSSDRFVATNGHYGYSCACLDGAFDAASSTVARIDDANVEPLSVCRDDRRLPPP